MFDSKMKGGLWMSNFTLNKLRFILILTLLLATSCRGDNSHIATLPNIPKSEFRTGDIAFRLGRSIESSVIAADGGYSHVGVIIRRDSALQVVHIEPSRKESEQTKYESLEDFFHPDKASAGAVMRIQNLDSAQCVAIENYLLSCRGISFDHDYTLSDSTKMYCTELVHRAYSTIGIDLTRGIRHSVPLADEPVILPSDIYQSEKLTKIWNYCKSDLRHN